MGLLFLIGIGLAFMTSADANGNGNGDGDGDGDGDVLGKGTLVPPDATEGAVIPVNCYPVLYRPDRYPPEYLAQVATQRTRQPGNDPNVLQWWGQFHEVPAVYRHWVICLEDFGNTGTKLRVSIWRQRAGHPIELSYESDKIWKTTPGGGSHGWASGEAYIARAILEKGWDPMVVDSPDNGITSLTQQKRFDEPGGAVEGPY